MLLLALVLAEATGASGKSAVVPTGGPPPPAEPPRAASPAAPLVAQVIPPPVGPPMAPPPDPSPPREQPARRSGRTEAPATETLRGQSRAPAPFTPNTTNPSLDAARSTIIPDRDALPHSLQDAPIAPYGPAPPDITPTREEGGPQRVQPIQPPPQPGVRGSRP